MPDSLDYANCPEDHGDCAFVFRYREQPRQSKRPSRIIVEVDDVRMDEKRRFTSVDDAFAWIRTRLSEFSIGFKRQG